MSKKQGTGPWGGECIEYAWGQKHLYEHLKANSKYYTKEDILDAICIIEKEARGEYEFYSSFSGALDSIWQRAFDRARKEWEKKHGKQSR